MAQMEVLLEDGQADVHGADGLDDDPSFVRRSPGAFLPDNRAEWDAVKVDVGDVRIHFNNYISLQLIRLFTPESSLLVSILQILYS